MSKVEDLINEWRVAADIIESLNDLEDDTNTTKTGLRCSVIAIRACADQLEERWGK